MLLKDENYKTDETVLCAVYHYSKPTEAIKRFEQRFPHVKFIWHTMERRAGIVSYDDVPEKDWKDATIYLTFGHSPKSPSDMPNLKFIQLLTAGHDHMKTTPIWSDPTIRVGTSSGVSSRAIAQYAVLQTLSFAHDFPRTLELQKQRNWAGADQWTFPRVLSGRRVGMLGYGAIARQAARTLHSMGMDIIACASGPRPTPESRRYTGYLLPGSEGMGDPEGTLPVTWHSSDSRENLHAFLGDSLDVIAIFCPLTDKTKNLFGKTEFDIMGSRSPLLINTSRGGIICQDEMMAALKDGRLLGAALDTVDPEPLPVNNELWGLPNVHITPHMTWAYDRYIENALEILAENIDRYESGHDLVNEIVRDCRS